MSYIASHLFLLERCVHICRVQAYAMSLPRPAPPTNLCACAYPVLPSSPSQFISEARCRDTRSKQHEWSLVYVGIMTEPLSPGNNLELSLLARGTGLMGGGVELECFGEDRRAFTLNVNYTIPCTAGPIRSLLQGEPFLKRSKSPEGQYAKPYRKCQLALPKTYVTRRGGPVNTITFFNYRLSNSMYACLRTL